MLFEVLIDATKLILYLNIGLNMLLSDSTPCLYSLLGSFTGEFQALQLIVLMVFGNED